MNEKAVAIRAAIGAVIGIAAMLLFRGVPSNAEGTATVVVAGLVGAGFAVTRWLALRRRIQWQGSKGRTGGPDLALWSVVAVVFIVVVGLFLWLMVSTQGIH